MRTKIVPVKNIVRLTTASKALLSRAAGAPGIGLVDGEAGYGKSTATAWLSNQHPSIYVRALAMWTPSAMLGALCRELRLPVGGSNAAMVERVAEALLRGEQTVWVDELDYILRQPRLVETLRDLHDLTSVPIVCIGEPGVLEKLSHMRRFTSRIAEHVTFEPLDEADTRQIAKDLCEVIIKPDLLQRIHRDTAGNTRNIVVSLARIEQLAKSQGLGEIGLEQVGKRALFSGDAPQAAGAK